MLLSLEQLEYDIDETKFGPGRSFFLPCLAPEKARTRVLREMQRRRYHVFIKIVIEDGFQGLRVWRVC
jgi:hypothetical protein